MLSQDLKEATKINHQVLERSLISKIKSIQNKEDYGQILMSFYEYFGALECAIERHLDLTRLPDYHSRRKTASLITDLKKLGLSIPLLAAGTVLPQITNHYHAMGALYVMEGSTLGGKIISKMISEQLKLAGSSALSFFTGYGDRTEPMWEEFKQVINQPLEVHEKAMVIEAANDTFIQFHEWFSHSLV